MTNNIQDNSNKTNNIVDTIVAQATPAGRGGVGIIRISGPNSKQIAEIILNDKCPEPRKAIYKEFKDGTETIDMGIALFFKAPNSFTGEDVFELQGHGGQIVINELINIILETGLARLAKPGEFSQQAFLNNKLDLVQAEAIADLISASSTKAARGAINSLNGNFSKLINEIIKDITYIRTYVESAIDFPDEEIDFLNDGKISQLILNAQQKLIQITKTAKQGRILNEGMKAVIVGKPNTGKSSLMNALLGDDYAIVTDIAGTTRDTLQEQILIDGIPLHIVDTAGLRETNDIVESIGIERAYKEIDKADVIILVNDSEDFNETISLIPKSIESITKIFITNKIDLTNKQPHSTIKDGNYYISISAKEQLGIDLLSDSLKQIIGYDNNVESSILARKRHLIAIEQALNFVNSAYTQLTVFNSSELVAEELRQAQICLSEIGGKFTADDLLTNIFTSFCIGK